MNNNYEIIEQRRIEDLNSEGLILKHKKTGAIVTLLLNDDENKVFYIGFRTTPYDSTGVAHILEHSVLCGSEKFPVKDPFIELAKGSLNTFLNAMTYPDKTVYPVASCNDKDFKNLVDVYLDAVFHPNIHKEEKIFRQEGWHYELESPEDELTINGVVYNEMKGVYSSADDVVEQEILKSLYPDTTYGYVSGGDPDDIPSLTYDDFKAFHNRYYHPSNSYIYIYGNLDPDEYLTFIDEEYLSSYDYLFVDSEVKAQETFKKPLELTKEYPVLSEDDEEGTYLTYNISMGTSLDSNLYVASDVLDYVLVSAPGGILKTALIEAGIGDEVYSSLEGGIYQPYFSIIAKGAKDDQKDEFVRIIEDTLKNVVKNGLPKKSLMAALNVFEFKYREADFGHYPRGLMLGLQAFDSWLYDKNKPFIHIEANETYRFLKEAISEGYFEKLIEDYMLHNTHKTILTVSPKAGLTQAKDEELRKKLANLKASWTKEEIEAVVEETRALKAYQSEPSPAEDLAKIPMLTMSDLKKEAVKTVNAEDNVNGTRLIKHDIFTNKIGYLTLLFDLKDIPKELFGHVGIFKTFLGMMNTENYDYMDLFDEINIHTGGITGGTACFVSAKNPDDYSFYLQIKSKMLFDQAPKAVELILEMLTKTKFNDEKRLRELVNETKSRVEAGMISSGHSVALTRAMSYFSKSMAKDEIVNGIPYLRLLQDYADNFDAKWQELASILTRLSESIFRVENLIVDYTAVDEAQEELKPLIINLQNGLFTTEVTKGYFDPDISVKNEGLKTAGQVQYVCRAGNFIKKNLPYTGALRVMHTILGYDYLWNNVRVLGGAYGCMNNFNRAGGGYFVSYRDPNLENTIKVYEDAAEYIRTMELDDRTILQFIIGTLSDIDIPMTPATRGEFSLRALMTNVTDEDNQRERDEILGITEEIIHGLGAYIDAIMSYNCLCVVGNAEAIDHAGDLFGTITELI